MNPSNKILRKNGLVSCHYVKPCIRLANGAESIRQYMAYA
jgi:hypothetical protein